MTAVIDHGVWVDTLGGVEAGMVNSRTKTLDLFLSPTDKRTVNLTQCKVTLKDGNIIQGVYNEIRSPETHTGV